MTLARTRIFLILFFDARLHENVSAAVLGGALFVVSRQFVGFPVLVVFRKIDIHVVSVELFNRQVVFVLAASAASLSLAALLDAHSAQHSVPLVLDVVGSSAGNEFSNVGPSVA